MKKKKVTVAANQKRFIKKRQQNMEHLPSGLQRVEV